MKAIVKWGAFFLCIDLMICAIALFWMYPYRPGGVLAWLVFFLGLPFFVVLNEGMGKFLLRDEWADRLWASVRLLYLFAGFAVIGVMNLLIVQFIHFMAASVFGWTGPYFVRWGQ